MKHLFISKCGVRPSSSCLPAKIRPVHGQMLQPSLKKCTTKLKHKASQNEIDTDVAAASAAASREPAIKTAVKSGAAAESVPPATAASVNFN